MDQMNGRANWMHGVQELKFAVQDSDASRSCETSGDSRERLCFDSSWEVVRDLTPGVRLCHDSERTYTF